MAKTWYDERAYGLRFYDNFLQLFCEKNSDGTKKLRLKGKELEQRFKDRLLPADLVYVCNFLTNHPEVNELDISYNAIEDEGMEIMCHMVFQHTNRLEHLDISNCEITAHGMKTFFFASKTNFIKLKTLRLCGNKLGPQGGHLTALAIPYIPDLEYLDVGDTDQTFDSIDCMFLQEYRSSIKVFNISGAIPLTSLTQIDNTSLAESIGQLFLVNKSLVEMHVQRCQLDAHGVETILVGLKRNPNSSLQFLDIAYNNICCVGVEFLAEWLKTRPNILGLNIAGNNVKNHGAIALSLGMPFSKLRYLDISQNHIDNVGIIAILNSIKKPYMLRYFMLWGNHFSHPALKVLHRMMLSKVFEQRGIDVKIYCVDGIFQGARYPVDHYKHRYYGVMDHGCAVELKIKRNKLETPDDKPRALVNFKHVDRYPPLGIPPKPDGVFQGVRYPVDKHGYYRVEDHGCARAELQIMRDDKPGALVNFKNVDGYPPLETPPKHGKSQTQ